MATEINHLAITCSLDQAHPADGDALRAFATLLSASLVAGAPDCAPQADWLRPWSWKISHWRFLLWDVAATPKKWRPLADVAASQPGSGAGADRLRAAVDDRLLLHYREPANWDEEDLKHLIWDPADGEETTTSDNPRPHLKHFLAALGTDPAPVPGLLGLADLVKVAAEAGAILIALPLFDHGSLDTTALLEPELPTADPSTTPLLAVPYLRPNLTLAPVKLYVMPLTLVETPAAGGYLDLATGWIREKPAGAAAAARWGGEDWTRRLTERIGEVFDLGQRLVDAVRADLKANPRSFASEAALLEIRQAVVEVERFFDPAGRSAAAWKKDLLAAFAALAPDLREIAAFAQTPPARSIESWPAELAELEKFTTVLTDDALIREMKLIDRGAEATALRQEMTRARVQPEALAILLELQSQAAHPKDALPGILRDHLWAQLKKFWPAGGNLTVFETPIKEALFAEAENFAADVFREADPGHDAEEGPGSPLPAPHPVVVQVARQAADDDTDVARRIQGYGLLMRLLGQTPWRCLNAAELRVGDQSLGPAIVPLRLGYRDGVKDTTLSYDNHPLAVTSPAAALARASDEEEWAVWHDDDTQPPPLYELAALTGENGKLPGLAFGQTYELAPFTIGNGGVFPRGLEPGNLQAAEPPAEALRKIRYVRRVPVGAPRLPRPTVALPNPLPLPPIPSTVAPRARELAAGVVPQDTPLLLLTPDDLATWPSPDGWERRRCEFVLARPTTDLLTWDRYAGQNTALEERVAVWARHFESGAQGREAPELPEPAVTGEFFIEARALEPAGEVLTDRSFLTQKFEVATHRSEAKLSPQRFEIPEGQIWMLTISAVIDEPRAAPLFHSELRKTWRRQAAEGGDLFLGPAFELLVEAAAKPAFDDAAKGLLLEALQVREEAGHIRVRLGRAGMESVLHGASKVEVRRQLWRWDGRLIGQMPEEVVPGAVAAEPPAELLEWETRAFAERTDNDHLRYQARIQANQSDLLLHDEERLDRRSLYYRFGVSLFSRYLGLLDPAAARLDAARPVVGGAITPWRRFLGSCTWSDPVPKPNLKLVVPLTDSPHQGATAALLVVLDEPWYEVGGLAEILKVDLEEVIDRRDPDHFVKRPELGPDPLLEGRGWNASQARPLLTLEGPVGYTFDTGSSAPLFVASSFLLEAPAGTDLSWHFAKLRFTRLLGPGGASSEKTDPVWVQFLPPSKRYQAELEAGSLTPVESGQLRLEPRADGIFLALGDQRVLSLAPAFKVDAEAKIRHDYLLLVTRRITDVRGRLDELFIGLFDIGTGQATFVPGDARAVGTHDRAKLRGRILEVQRRKAVAENRLTLEDLFPPATATQPGKSDARARITRISPPVGEPDPD